MLQKKEEHAWKSRYPHLIATGMMQFQGRQTVRNMLVITVLVAGAYFAAFYAPMLTTSAQHSIAGRTVDYAFFSPAGTDMPDRTEIERLAEENAVIIKNYVDQPSVTLAVDGELHVETEGSLGATYTKEYQPVLESGRFFSCRVLDDVDYAAITQGLTDDWREVQVLFNAEHDSYVFAKSLFHEIVAQANEDMAVISSYDRVTRELYHARGEEYFADPENAEKFGIPVIDYAQPDSSEFRQN